jgi:arabinogalactan endo-1,4-beta-galactosidase
MVPFALLTVSAHYSFGRMGFMRKLFRIRDQLEVDNTTLFDFDGHALPVLCAFYTTTDYRRKTNEKSTEPK